MGLRPGVFWRAILLPLLAPAALGAAGPEFVGVMTWADRALFSVTDHHGGAARWLGVGDQYDGCTIMAYQPSDETLTVQDQGARAVLRLRPAKVFATTLTSDEIHEAAEREIYAREGWDAHVRWDAPRLVEGSWLVYAHNQVDGKIDTRLVIVTPQGYVAEYVTHPDP